MQSENINQEHHIEQGYVYRCTFCKQHIPRPLTAQMLGMGPEEKPIMGKLYRYSGCYCGHGRFVICEQTYTLEETEDDLTEHMAH